MVLLFFCYLFICVFCWVGVFGLLVVQFIVFIVLVQFLGGFYGFVLQCYVVFQVVYVYFVVLDGQVDVFGVFVVEFMFIEVVIGCVVMGDVIVMCGGIYCIGGLEFNQGVII